MPARWTSLHCYLHAPREETDAFLTEDVDPLVAGVGYPWFFIRYGEGGPHVRVRVRDAPDGMAERLAVALADRAAARPATVLGPWQHRHGEVRAVPYEPELARYGGDRAMPVAERVFVDSTRIALSALSQLLVPGDRLPANDRLTTAVDLALATAVALGMDRLAAARWLRGHAASWHWATGVDLLPAAAVHAKVNTVFAAQRTGLVARVQTWYEPNPQRSAPPWLAEWFGCVQEADAQLRVTGPGQQWPHIWSSQLHMTCNRLGVAPDEERALCRLAAKALLAADDGDPGFFPDDHRAPHVQYLERSKFQLGRQIDSAPRDVPPLAVPAEPSPAEQPLSAEPLPQVSLAEVMSRRVSRRGRLVGPLTASQLGALLWSAHATTHQTHHRPQGQQPYTVAHRAYPSAGALYTAGLRLFVMDVDGVAPGCYHVLPQRRSLSRIGPAPELGDLTAVSSYLSRPADDPLGIDISAAPAVLGLYVDLGRLRARYGLRALRLGLLEAGHLAQSLLLAATALGLSSTPVNGFHDDLAHELFGLDDLDQPLQYLLPLGRSTPPAG